MSTPKSQRQIPKVPRPHFVGLGDWELEIDGRAR
jgi:hypothetical protein